MACSAFSPDDHLMSPHLPITPAVVDSPAWTSVLRGPPTRAREDALATLHPLLLRATRFALSRQRDQLRDVGAAELDDLAVQAADDALISILRQLDDYRGASRFTTWAYKFAVHEAGVTGQRRASQPREALIDLQADGEVEQAP
jgi:RNA polymerase sigma-70 factor (ECF subfamily)